MIRSMTGFAHREIAQPGLRASLEIKSYNNRYLDLSVSLPPYLTRLEPRFREYISARVAHGKVEAWLRVRELETPVSVSADLAAARALAGVLREMAEACGVEEPLRLGNLLSFDGVLAYERDVDEEELWARLGPELEACFSEYDASRLHEGESTMADLEAQLARVSAAAAAVRARVPEIELTVRVNLMARFKEVAGDAVDEGRVLTETAALLMKYTVNEELSRLDAHIASFSRIAKSERAPGKKLDFLCQEMNREVNTIGSKSMLLAVSREVVEFKDALENIREQLRNIE